MWSIGAYTFAELCKHEAFRRIDKALEGDRNDNVFRAFLILGRTKPLFYYFDRYKQELYKKAKETLISPDFSEDDLREEAERGLSLGEQAPFPVRNWRPCLHCGFVAEMISLEIGHRLSYELDGVWRVKVKDVWVERLKECGIIGVIYGTMKWKIDTWREVKLPPPSREVFTEWIEEVEKNISDPAWLNKVEELLRRVEHFGVLELFSYEFTWTD